MSWPTVLDYSDALQNPSAAFSDPELRRGDCARNEIRPLAWSGNFATVFRVNCASRSWGVKCFTKCPPDLQARYDAIAGAIRHARLPCMMGFQYLPQGISVKSTGISVKSLWYPVVKMEWIQGERLDEYVGRNLKTPRMLHALAQKFLDLVLSLAHAGIAHGDLQDGNLLVVNGELRLVDYDGMFVPALAGLSSTEKGHRNYQHPGRSDSHFGPFLDHFPAWLIYLSLLALSYAPQLWTELGGGDECLILRERDLRDPDHSKVFQLLESSRDPRLHSTACILRELLAESVTAVPLPARGSVPLPGAPAANEQLPSWLLEETRQAPAPPKELSMPAPGNSEAGWIFDLLDQASAHVTPLGFDTSFGFERLLLCVSIVAAMSPFVLLGASGAATVIAMLVVVVEGLINALSWRHRFGAETAHAERRRIRQDIHGIDREIQAVEELQARFREQREQHVGRRRQQRGAIESARSRSAENESSEVGLIRITFAQKLEPTRARVRALDEEGATLQLEVAQLEQSCAAEEREVQGADAHAAAEVGRCIAAKQSQYVEMCLRVASVAEAHLPRIGEMLKERLQLAGVRSAWDVEYWAVQQVPGIGPKSAETLHYWRENIRIQALGAIQRLTPSEEAAIRQPIERRRQSLQASIAQKHLGIKSKRVRLQECRGAARVPLQREEVHLHAAEAVEVKRVRERYMEILILADRDLQVHDRETVAGLKKIDDEWPTLHKRMFPLKSKRALLGADLGRYSAIRWANYLRRIAGLPAKP